MGSATIRKVSLSEQLFEILRKDMDGGKYALCQRLPSEAALAKEYGVSRLTVRAAMARLHALGYIETRNGEGSFYLGGNKDKLLENISSVVTDSQMLKDVNSFRLLIEGESLRLAIQSSPESNIEMLKNISNEFSMLLRAPVNDQTEFINKITDCDFRFHLAICELSGNSLYVLAYKAAQEAIKQHIASNTLSRWYYNNLLGGANEKMVNIFIEGHTNLLNAIYDRDYKSAYKTLSAHIDYNSLKFK